MLIHTARLVLVRLSEADHAAIRSGDRVGRLWAPDYPGPDDLLLADLAGQAEGEVGAGIWGQWQICWAADDVAIGGAGFKGPPDDGGAVEIGYAVVASQRGQGVATEAVAALIAEAQDRGARAVIAETEPGNLASQAVLRACGFSPWVGMHPASAPAALWWRRELRV